MYMSNTYPTVACTYDTTFFKGSKRKKKKTANYDLYVLAVQDISSSLYTIQHHYCHYAQ